MTIGGAGLAGTIGGPFSINSLNAAPSDIINVGLIGCKNMGFGVLKKQLEFEDARCVAMCDVDEKILNERATEVGKTYGQKPTKYGDFRKLLENKDIDAVIVSTPDHWHCLPMIGGASWSAATQRSFVGRHHAYNQVRTPWQTEKG